MLPESQIQAIAKIIKVDAAKLSAAMKSDKEETVELADNLTVLSEAELKLLKDTEYNNGKKKGVEMEIKNFREESGLEFTGKTIKSLAEAVSKKALDEAQIEEPEQVTKVKKQLETVQTNYKNLEKTLLEKDNHINAAKTEAELFRNVPSLEEGMLPVEKLTKLMKVDGYEFTLEDGKLVAKLNGEILADNTSQPLPVKDVIVKYSADQKLHTPKTDTPTPPIGRGGGNAAAVTKPTKRSEVDAMFKAEGKSTQGMEYTNTIRALKKDNPDFNINE